MPIGITISFLSLRLVKIVVSDKKMWEMGFLALTDVTWEVFQVHVIRIDTILQKHII